MGADEARQTAGRPVPGPMGDTFEGVGTGMKIQKYVKRAAAVMTAVIALSMPVLGAAPYQNYTYDYEGMPSAEPQAYIPTQVITGASLRAGDLTEPEELFIDSSGKLYVSDTGNNRILVLSSEYQLLQTITGFQNNGQQDAFSGPRGLFVTDDGDIYVADTGNKRVVALDKQGGLIRTLGAPDTGKLVTNFDYQPLKVMVDFAGRIYVVSKNCTEGVVQFDADGTFLGFFGAIQTQTSVWDLFWRSIATKEQREAMGRIVPTEYSSIDIDAEGFIYGTVSAIDTSKNFDNNMFIHKLNPMGSDVLKRLGVHPPMGDVFYTWNEESEIWNISRFVDVAVQPCGMYSALDSYKGRVFTYNESGDLLYIFGGLGESLGEFDTPVAMDVTADRKFLVLDKGYGQIVEFAPTEYGSLISQAEISNYQRQYEKSEELWFQALKYTAKSELVFSKIGQSYSSQGQYEKSMQYSKFANDRTSYSEAYQNYRIAFLDRYFGVFMTVILVLIAAYIAWKTVKKRRKKAK